MDLAESIYGKEKKLEYYLKNPIMIPEKYTKFFTEERLINDRILQRDLYYTMKKLQLKKYAGNKNIVIPSRGFKIFDDKKHLYFFSDRFPENNMKYLTIDDLIPSGFFEWDNNPIMFDRPLLRWINKTNDFEIYNSAKQIWEKYDVNGKNRHYGYIIKGIKI